MKNIRILLLTGMFAAFLLHAGDAPAASRTAPGETAQVRNKAAAEPARPAQPEKVLAGMDDAVITTEGNNKTILVHLFPVYHAGKYRGKKVIFRMNVKRTEGSAPLKCRFRSWGSRLLADKSYPVEYGKNGETVPVECVLNVPDMEELKHFDMSISFTRQGLEKCTWELSNARFVDYEEAAPSEKKTVDMGLAAEFTAGHEEKPLVLVKDGKIGFVIVTADKPDFIARYAAKELKDHFALACGAAPEIVRESQYKSGPAIMVGETAAAKKYGINPSLQAPETLTVARLGDVIVLAGGDNPAIPAYMVSSYAQVPVGTLYAAYEFLEKTVGFRWYWPGKNGTYVPEIRDLEVTKLFTISQPRYDTRITLYSDVVNDPDVSAKDTAIWHRRNRFGGSKGNPIANHAYNGWVKRFAESHPEYFALQSDGKRKTYSEPCGGHVCMSNPDVLRQTVEDKLAEFERNKFSDFAKVMPGDSNGLFYCKCPECQAKLRPEKGTDGLHSDAVWGFVNKAAAEIAVKAPGKNVACCAYENYRSRPSFPLLPNIAVTLCFYPPPRACLPYKQAWHKHLEEWGSAGARLYMWEYWCYTRYYNGVWGAPAVFPRQIKELYAMDAGRISGHAIELCNKDGDGKPFRGWSDWIYDVQNLYVAGKLLWDPAADVETILDEYYTKFFGPAAGPVRAFHEEMEKAWVENGYLEDGWDYQQAWQKAYPPAFVDRMMGLLREAVKLAGDREPYAYRTKKLLDGYAPFERNSRMFRGLDKETNPKNITVPKAAGAPSDADWEKAVVLKNFVDSYNAYELKSETVLRLLHDGKNLYVKVQCRIPDGAASVKWAPDTIGKRDGLLWNYESIEFFLARGRESCQFILAPDDCLLDLFNSPGSRETPLKWNAEKVRWSAVRKGGNRWEGSLVIPLDELPFAEAGREGEYRFNVCRNCLYVPQGEPAKSERSCYLPTFGSFQNIDRFGTLTLGK